MRQQIILLYYKLYHKTFFFKKHLELKLFAIFPDILTDVLETEENMLFKFKKLVIVQISEVQIITVSVLKKLYPTFLIFITFNLKRFSSYFDLKSL